MTPKISAERIDAAYQKVRDELMALREGDGYWRGELSSSALSTATAVSALAIFQRHACVVDLERTSDVVAEERLSRLILCGLHWLAEQQNEDGGWGDTDRSFSNISTTMLVRAAFTLGGVPADHADAIARADKYLANEGGVEAIRRRYGKDRTFAVPILTNAALADLVSWREITPLPFEMACLPHSLLRFVRLPVVSYALPALIAVGLARYVHRRPWNPVARLVRRLAVDRSLKKLEGIQPDSGGFLEATPLTSFVVMSLAGSGYCEHPVVARGVAFLVESVREDGSWPIDTDLAHWVTTLATGALANGGEPVDERLGEECLEWILGCQHRTVHPFTNADPGGWGWTDHTGAVPDADDTPAALLALLDWPRASEREDVQRAARLGVDWLLGLQNSDGGWPTFCRGWGMFPFDRSGADLTAHVIRALFGWRQVWMSEADSASKARCRRIEAALRRGFAYLARVQDADGSWLPLWFGNQHHREDENPVYGTTRVLAAYAATGRMSDAEAERGIQWLVNHQNHDSGWCGATGAARVAGAEPSSVEETSLAIEALLTAESSEIRGNDVSRALDSGLEWLVRAVEEDAERESVPIGFYFAKLWYHEKLYPYVFATRALGRARQAGREILTTIDDEHLGDQEPEGKVKGAVVERP